MISIFTSWFWVAVVFHKYQRQTPQTWRAESNASHLISSVIQIAACIALATMFVLMTSGGAFGAGMYGAICFAIVGWIAFVGPVLLNTSIYVNLHPLVVVGLLLNWLTTALLACGLTGWWLHH